MGNVHFLHLVPYLTFVNPDILSRNVETIRVECSHVYYLSSMVMMTIETINNTIYYDDDGDNYDHDEIVSIMMTMTIITIIIIITITIIPISPHDDLHQSAELTPHSF